MRLNHLLTPIIYNMGYIWVFSNLYLILIYYQFLINLLNQFIIHLIHFYYQLKSLINQKCFIVIDFFHLIVPFL